jgi:hypothetical protein
VIEVGFRFDCIGLRRRKRNFSGNAMDFGLPDPLLSSFYRCHRFINALPSVTESPELAKSARFV